MRQRSRRQPDATRPPSPLSVTRMPYARSPLARAPAEIPRGRRASERRPERSRRRADTRKGETRQMATETASRARRSTAGRIRAPDDRGPGRAPARDADDARHRGARDDALPPGQGPRLLLRRLRPGGRLGRARPGRWPPQDRLCILHRDLAAHLIRGVEPQRIFAQYMGRAGGITGGRDGNVHFGDRTKGCVGMVSMLPDMMLIATGLAMAFKLRGEQRVRDHLVRRRLDLARRLPRGDELGRRAEACRSSSCSRTTSTRTRRRSTSSSRSTRSSAPPPTASRA